MNTGHAIAPDAGAADPARGGTHDVKVTIFDTILVAVDGSRANVAAQETAGRLSAMCGAGVIVVCVLPVRMTNMGDERAEREAFDFLLDARYRVEGVGGTVTRSIDRFEGSHGLAGTILEVAREEGADLIVSGTRGHGRLAGAVLGSVSQGLLRRPPCPVLVVPDTGP